MIIQLTREELKMVIDGLTYLRLQKASAGSWPAFQNLERRLEEELSEVEEAPAEQAAKIREIAQMAFGDDIGHDNFRVVDESIPEHADDYTDGGYWVTARVWVPLSWVKATKP
jgi:hypothetical protein